MKNQLIFTLILLPFLLFAKSKKDKFGSVKIESLQQSSHPLESDAKAAILIQDIDVKTLYDKGKGQWVTYTEVYQRIKIYDGSETDRANFIIPFYDYGSSKESLSGIKGITYNLVNGKMVKTELDKKSVFDERTSKYYSQMKIAMPNVKEGSVVELKYKVKSPILRIPRRFVQFDIPCDKTIYRVEVPEYFSYNTSTTGFVPMNVEDDRGSDMVTFITKTRSGVNNSRTTMGSEALNFDTKIKIFTIENTPSLQDEDFVPQMDNYRGSVKYELSGYEIPGVVSRSFLKSWNDIAEDMNEDSDFGKFLNQKKKELNSIVSNWKDLDEMARAESIYNYVQENYRWNDYYGVGSFEGLGNLLKNKTGNIADINLLLVKLLRAADLIAHPVVSRSRDMGFMNIYYPTVAELNYVMAALVTNDGNIILLDASSNNHYFGTLPPRAINLKGVVITDTNEGLPIDIKNPNKGKTIVLADISYDDVDGLTVGCKMKKTRYEAIRLWSDKSQFNTDSEWYEHLESKNEDKDFEHTEVTFSDHLSKGATITQDFIDEYSAEMIGNELHIDATFGFGAKSHPYKSESRSFPLFYNSSDSDQYTVKFKIPDGFEIESVPEPLTIALPDRQGTFTYTSLTQNNSLVVQIKLERNVAMISPEFYPALKEFYSQVVKKSNEKIVLKKV